MNQGVFSDPPEHSSKSVFVPDPTLLELVREWADASRIAREEYVKAARSAYDGGHTWVDIGSAADVSPDAVRMLLKRTS